jgi:endonuclease YncB( thermonuclease family)
MELTNITCSDVKFFTLSGMKLKGKVVDVYDGDTVHVIINFYNKLQKFKCRIMGIDTPEMKQPINGENREMKKRCAKIARNTLVSLVTNCDVDVNYLYNKSGIKNLLNTNTLIVDIEFYEFDKYGRCLIDINKVSEKMVTMGMANSYDGGTKKIDFDSYHATK